MNNKYYTPTIEEFHIGFEYEELINFDMLSIRPDDHIDRVEWCKINLQDFQFMWLNEIRSKLEFESIRVKYLDKEDIESLGFLIKVETKFGIIFSNQLYSIILSKMKLNHIEVYLTQPYINESDGLTFSGTIKNKSELKVLLKQLNIS